MKARIVRIGNSRGIRIPKPLLEQAGLEEDVELEVREEGILIRRASRPRAGWEEAFRAAAAAASAAGEEEEVFWPDDMKNDFDDEEWEW